MIRIVTAIFASYIIGAIPFSFMIGSKYKQNLFLKGNRKSGAANVLKTSGLKPALLAFTADFTKGSGTMIVARSMGFESSIVLLLAMSTIVGHWKSIFIRFKGGDGYATLAGITLAMFNMAGFITFAGAGMITYGARFFKYSSTLSVPGGYLILLLCTRNINLQVTGMGAIYFLVFFKSNYAVIRQKYLK